MKRIVILGSTGSIGTSALRVVQRFPERFEVVGLSARDGYTRLLEQAAAFDVGDVAVADAAAAEACAAAAPSGIRVHVGSEGLATLASLESADLVLCSVVGLAGLDPVMAAIDAGKDVALATKEVLVAAGGVVTQRCRERGVRILPVDSEHSAILQCLQGAPRREVRRLVLTASGGPFAARPEVDFNRVSVDEALAHPRWDMGKKVSVDSATLMNKGLEILEAHWLFDLPVERIDVVLHPESIVHSLVEFVDGVQIAQLSVPDMRFAIQYALAYPERLDGGLPSLDLAEAGRLSFREPDADRFPCLKLAREAASRGGTLPVVLNASNEIAVRRFLAGEVPFAGIWRIVETVMGRHTVRDNPDLGVVREADAWARHEAKEIGVTAE